MFIKNFHNILDKELIDIVAELQNSNQPYISKHSKDVNVQKSYAFLVWFIRFYVHIYQYEELINEGVGDSSCDIIFDKINHQNERVFYIIQSKWKSRPDKIDKNELLKSLNDFDTILRGSSRNPNQSTEKKLLELRQHLKANGEVKFVFISTCKYEQDAEQNIATFNQENIKANFLLIDIEKIRLDYIDKKFKNISPRNPLEMYKNPEESPIRLDIISKRNYGMIKIEKPFDACVVLVRPKIIWQLFKEYEFSLFQKNVRNPLLASEFNQEIEKTALEEPTFFWYYNNGITAITSRLPAISNDAETIEITGLQIINGAQTVYSIYRAYENANTTRREIINEEMLVSFRLLKSGSKDSDLKITRYTNSQNPVLDSDFFANDDIQIQLQQASYQYNFWYEKRRAEFRAYPEGINIVENTDFALLYLIYQLQEPNIAINNLRQQEANAKKQNLNFVSHRDNPNGLYEKIFNKKIIFADMLAAYFIFTAIPKTGRKNSTMYFFELALSKIVFQKYFKAKFNLNINSVNEKIIEWAEKQKTAFLQVLSFVRSFFLQTIDTEAKLIELMQKSYLYQQLRDRLESQTITAQEIESIELTAEPK